MSNVKFCDNHIGVYCCGHLFRGERSALLVVREGYDWQFLCGEVDHNDPLEPYHVSVGVLVNADPSLQEIGDLAADWEAERTNVGEGWIRTTGIQ